MKWGPAAWAAASAGVAVGAAFAQEHLDEPDNGTNPARLRRSALVSFEHLDLRGDSTRGTFKGVFETPIADKVSFRIQVPLARVNDDDQAVKDDFRRGDIALRLNYIYDVNRERGIVIQGELISVLGPLLGGSSQVYIKPSVYLGGHSTADWGIEVAFKLLGF